MAAVVLGAVHLAASLDERPLDDPDPVFQRPGFLDAHGPPFAASRVSAGLPVPGRRSVFFFVRLGQSDAFIRGLHARPGLAWRAHLAVVVAGSPARRPEPLATWIADPSGLIAGAYRMPIPRDGGPPVGYAIVDSAGMVRYRTLDPTMAERLKDVDTMLKATP